MADWTPSDRQAEFLAVAQGAFAGGKVLPGQWIQEAMGVMDEPPTPREWAAWRDDDDFWAWWEDGTPWSVGLDKAAMQALDHLFWASLGRNMAMGDAQSLGIYAKVKSDAAFADALTGVRAEIEEYLTAEADPFASGDGDPPADP